MEEPIAFKLGELGPVKLHRVALETAQAQRLKPRPQGSMPAIVVTRNAAVLPDVSAGVFDAADVIAVSEGNWDETLLIVLPSTRSTNRMLSSTGEPGRGDAEFLADVARSASALVPLAELALRSIRESGVTGELVRSRLGKWVNQPLNTFTLKAQPRAGNLHFTLYGDPGSYKAEGFLRKDQNSYSRGWLRCDEDVKRFVELVQEAHARRIS